MPLFQQLINTLAPTTWLSQVSTGLRKPLQNKIVTTKSTPFLCFNITLIQNALYLTHKNKSMINKLLFTVVLLYSSVSYSFGQQAKYVFYMIGDGMGINHVHLTEMFQSELQGEIGRTPLVFSQFPHSTFVTTYSATHGVTDSAAGGTALATGKKTKNGVIGMDSTGTVPYRSIAYAAKDKGLKVGITTTVSIDHATPASFYAHQPSRSMAYEIAQEIVQSNFDFFAGAGFVRPNTTHDKKDAPSIFPQFEKAGYTLVKGYDAFQKQKRKGQKIILTDVEGTPTSALPYAIDHTENGLTLAEITSAAIESLSSDNKNGFFLMVEGGKIDHSSHGNDAMTTIQEVLAFNEAVKIAHDFYQKHPEETLIVVTADHETGGIIIGNGPYGINTTNLQRQTLSQGELSNRITELRDRKPDATWEDVKNILSSQLGLWTDIKVSKSEEEPIFKAYQASFINHQEETQKTLYASDNKIAALAVKLLNTKSNISWASTGHSATAVPVFAIGSGAEKFSKSMDNTDVPKKIAEAAGLEL